MGGEMGPPPLPMRPPPPKKVLTPEIVEPDSEIQAPRELPPPAPRNVAAPMHPPAPRNVAAPMHPPAPRNVEAPMHPPASGNVAAPMHPPASRDASQVEMRPPASRDVFPAEIDPPAPTEVSAEEVVSDVAAGPVSVAQTDTEKPNRTLEGRPERPYIIPEWSQMPGTAYKIEVLKEGAIVDVYEASQKGAYMFGRHESVDFVLDHPSISRYHAVLQYNGKGNAFIYDLGSTHGTFINKMKVKAKVHAPLHVGDMLRFGLSTRFYILQGPQELMPQEGLLRQDRIKIKQLEALQSRADAEASLARARIQDSVEGASWGMDADAVEEEIRDEEEITWQTHQGQLNEKQQKNLDQITKRNEKLTNLKKEIDAIQAKENAQGGLTQGQQTQVARNEKRIEELLEQLENLEETLNESIRESVLGRKRTTKERKKKLQEEDGEFSDDEFYDRTKKKQKKEQEAESASSLLEKIKRLDTEIEEIRKQAKAEEEARVAEMQAKEQETRTLDPLDAFMSDVSTKIVEDAAAGFNKEIMRLQEEADRLRGLLKIADPSGDSTRRWENEQAGVLESTQEATPITEPSGVEEAPVESEVTPVSSKNEPVWIGAPRPEEPVEPKLKPMEDDDTTEQFIHYKDRKTKLGKEGTPAQEPKTRDKVADDIALLLRSKTGLTSDLEDKPTKKAKRKRKAKGKKVLGPDRPDFLGDDKEAAESWLPPEGQTGDGRTALNDKFGY